MSRRIKLGENFYTRLQAITDFRDISKKEFYRELPKGWWIFITGIVYSTTAIESGKYKVPKDYKSSYNAIMTRYIQLSTDSEVHFIDAANGSYAMAAKQLKKQMHDE